MEMDGETKIYVTFWQVVGAVFIVLIISIAAVSLLKDSRIDAMHICSKGATAESEISVKCAAVIWDTKEKREE